MSRRVMGKASFVELQDSKGRIQIYITRDDICPDENKDLYNVVFKRLLDLGDFIGIEGFVFRTQMGEISIHAQKLTVLSKSIRPLPIVKYKDGVAYDKFDDPELRYRQRYVDLVVNDGVKDIFLKRNKVYNSMREYFKFERDISKLKLLSCNLSPEELRHVRSLLTIMHLIFLCICVLPANFT